MVRRAVAGSHSLHFPGELAACFRRNSGQAPVMILERYPEIAQLSPEDKLLLVQELWDDLDFVPNEALLTPEQIDELDRRVDEFERNPEQGSNWEDVKARILAKRLPVE